MPGCRLGYSCRPGVMGQTECESGSVHHENTFRYRSKLTYVDFRHKAIAERVWSCTSWSADSCIERPHTPENIKIIFKKLILTQGHYLQVDATATPPLDRPILGLIDCE
jgi:hypothetical protein